MEMVIDKEKKELRQKLLKRLFALAQEELKRRSKNVEEKLSSLPIYKEAKVIMAYYPLGGEVDVLGLVRKALNCKEICFPVMDLKTKSMRVFRVTQLDKDFVLGPFGVMEPDITRTKEVDVQEIDLVIIPGLAFDRKGNRLGRGAGFYDRFLEKTALFAKKVGVAFEFQILDNLPIQLPSDQKVDFVVSENSII